MKRRDFIKFTSASGLAVLVTPVGVFHVSDNHITSVLEEGFLDPPDSGRTHTFWFWMNGNVTKGGITSDLEAIKEAGVGGVLNFDAGTGMIKGPVEYGSPEYWDLKKHAIDECNRLGLFFGMHNCPGWSSSGGPWVTPEYSMLEVSWSETFLQGGRHVEIHLPEPYGRENFYQDTFVLAYPSLKGELPLNGLFRKVTSGRDNIDIDQLTDDPDGVTVTPEEPGEDACLQFEFTEPYEATYLSFISRLTELPVLPSGFGLSKGWIKLEASMDGVHFENISTADLGMDYSGDSGAPAFISLDFHRQKARYFRLSASHARNFSMLRFSGAERIQAWKSKANYLTGNTDVPYPSEVSQSSVIDPGSVIDLSDRMDSGGNLVWDAPAGNWTILRLGYTTKGTKNRAAPAGGEGLEIDKYSKEAMDMHFNAMMKELLPDMEPLAKQGKVFLEIDSWEVGLQNWTPRFPEEFRERTGYNLQNYLPILTGRIVGSAEESDRFLWDFRRIQADLVADNYYGHFNELCKKYGFNSYNEPYENGPFEEMQIGSRVDVSMGEFWSGLSIWFQHNYEHRRTVRLCASIAHTSGRKIVGAEAFTAEAPSGKWQQYPFALKALGDKYFTEGLTRVVFHRYAMQPHPDSNIAPGMTMSYWGMHFERTNTWWKQGSKWLDYLSRCQYMLQQGVFVADFAYFTGEDTPKHTTIFRNELRPIPPEGYDYDVVNREVILNRMEIRGGRIVLPDGMSYRILVMQDFDTMSLELVQKLHELVSKGMILIGAKPKRTPGLGKRSGDNKAMLHLADELWGPIDGSPVMDHHFGKGWVFWGDPMDNILNKLGIVRDFGCSSRSGDAPVHYIHRKTDQADLYFICNERRQYEDLVCTFRVDGKQPEFWDADSGKKIKTGFYEIKQGRTVVPVRLKPYGSLFVVFRSPATAHFQKLEIQNKLVFHVKPFPDVAQISYTDVSDNFSVCFWVKPEIDIMLQRGFGGLILNDYREWTEYYAIYPPSGKELYGEGHETSGVAVGRNGVAIWHRETKWPFLKMIFPKAIEGWTHIAIIYKAGDPAVFLNGSSVEGQLKEIKADNATVQTIHPGLGKAFLNDGASYYNGDMTTPELFKKVLDKDEIKFQMALTQTEIRKQSKITADAEMDGGDMPEILFLRNGNYRLTDEGGRTSMLKIAAVSDPLELSGEWDIHFPPGLGAPEQIKLPELISLHKHDLAGIKYFSGTATYTKNFYLEKTMVEEHKRLFLDLGRVEIAAEVFLNGKGLGVLWTRPYRVEITDAVKEGENDLSVRVVNLWPNRLIGDEQLPPEYEYDQRQGDLGACIREMPDWYLNGAPKPQGKRVAFTTWQHYQKNDSLLESGLIGPVLIMSGITKKL